MKKIKNTIAEIVLFTVYITMRILSCLSFWNPFPRYSDWKVCTEPDYKTTHIGQFLGLLIQVAVIMLIRPFISFWWATLIGVVVLNLVLLVVWLIRRGRNE
jgi:hypothetical protein